MRWPVLILSALALAACDVSNEQDEELLPPPPAVKTPAEPIPEGSVPRGAAETRALLAPPGPPVTPRLLVRGREAYGVFCTPCHGQAGDGFGTVTANGFPRPPSFQDERRRGIEPAYVVAVISEGKGLMYPMAERVMPEERWAIAHYVKTLQGAAPLPEPLLPGTENGAVPDGRQNRQ